MGRDPAWPSRTDWHFDDGDGIWHPEIPGGELTGYRWQKVHKTGAPIGGGEDDPMPDPNVTIDGELGTKRWEIGYHSAAHSG
jgi:hypothetical protein